MDRLDRGAGAECALLVHPEQTGRRHREQGTEPLAAADAGMAHRREQAVAAVAGVGEILFEQAVDRLRDARAGLVEVGRRHAALN